MAEQYNGDYKKTQTYAKADGEKRSKIERFRKENKLDDGQMYLLLLREDLRNLPKEEKQKGNRVAELLVLSGIISFLVLTARNARQLLPYQAVYMIIVTAVYFSGILNPVARQLSNINKLLKKYPKQVDLRKYLNEEKEEE
ncbi:MAG: hypothetical protein IKI61_09075 [Erysipelotrichaceae bacterium]|jgi:hypothetical protein|nr:hypothetical protein [Erysipelotrichaceae bacterium]